MTVNPGSLHQIGVIARLTIREARRRSLFWIGLGLSAAFIALFTVGFYFAHQDFVRSMGARAPGVFNSFISIFLMAGLYVVNFLIVMVTVLTSVGAISQEIATDTIHAIAAKPIRRWEIVLGKWLGYAAMLSLLTIILAVGLILAIYLISGYLPPNPLSGMAILILECLAILSATLLGGSLLSTLPNGVVIFMLYGVAFVGGWVEQIGALLGSQTAQDLGIASSLLMPCEALWRYAANLMQGTDSLIGSVSPFSLTSQPTPAFVVYSVIYTLGLLGMAMWAFSQRDF